MSDGQSLNRFAVKLVNLDSGLICWLSDMLAGSIPLCSSLLDSTFTFRTAWRHAQVLRHFYSIVEVVAVRE